MNIRGNPMQTEKTVATEIKPKITLLAEDYERLSTLAHAARNKMPRLAAVLAEELGRARVLAGGMQPEHIVSMNTEVEFRDETSRKIRTVLLVYPEQADISQGKVSVLTPVGTALLGLRTGDSITWETPAGEIRQLTVLGVRRCPPAKASTSIHQVSRPNDGSM
jgi:regulator of nucleoside diphosphate kinase